MRGKNVFLNFLVPILGVLGALLQSLLYRFGMDDRGLLIASHPLKWALWALTAGTVLLVIFCLRKIDFSHSSVSSVGIPAALGSWAMAAGVLLLAAPEFAVPIAALSKALPVLRWASAAALAAAGYCQFRKQQPAFILPCIFCVFLVLLMIFCYQDWSRNPQVQDYVFPLLANIAMALFSYYLAAAAAGMPSHRMLRQLGLIGCFLCCTAAARGNWLFYLPGALWMLSNQPDAPNP